jgi:hypothetical protein
MMVKEKIVISLLLSIILIVFVGVFRFTPLSSELKANYFWLNKFENTSKVDVVVYGDSRTYRGFSPDVLLEGTNLTGYNYGFTSAGYSSEIFELIESRIDRTKDPVILLGITPYSLTLKASENNFYHQEKGREGLEKFTRLNIDQKLSFFDRIVMDEYFKPNAANVIQEYNSDGWVASSKTLIDTLAGLKSYRSIFDGNQVSDSIINLVLLNVSQWVKSGVRVYAYRPPTVIAMELLENDKSGFNAALFVTGFEKAGGIWIPVPNDGRYISYDASHLQKESAIDLSRSIRKYIFD